MFFFYFIFVCSPGKRGIAGATGAQQLYGGKAPASSRGSNGTVGDNEDFCSDASLEDDVVDLGHKVRSFLSFSVGRRHGYESLMNFSSSSHERDMIHSLFTGEEGGLVDGAGIACAA